MKVRRIVITLALVAGVVSALQFSPTPEPQEVAGRYHLRQRTQRFFERSTRPARREATPRRNAPNEPARRVHPIILLPKITLLG